MEVLCNSETQQRHFGETYAWAERLITPPFYFIKKIIFAQAEALKNESTKERRILQIRCLAVNHMYSYTAVGPHDWFPFGFTCIWDRFGWTQIPPDLSLSLLTAGSGEAAYSAAGVCSKRGILHAALKITSSGERRLG